MPTNEQFLFYGLFVTAFGLVLVWGALLKLFFKRLEQAHPQEYAAMGRPSIFWRNGPSVSVSLVKFLVRCEHRALKDSYLSSLSNAMLIVLVVYFLLFIALGGLIIGLGADRLTMTFTVNAYPGVPGPQDLGGLPAPRLAGPLLYPA